MSLCVLPHDEPAEPLPGLLICGRHRHKLDDLTREIGLLIVDTQRITDGGAPSEQSAHLHKHKIAASPAPGNVTIMAMFDHANIGVRIPPRGPDHPLGQSEGDPSEPVAPVLKKISYWLIRVASERPLTSPLPSSVLAQLNILTRHHEWAACQEWISYYWTDLTDLQRLLRDVTHDHTHHRIATCDLPTEDGRGTALIIHRNRAWRIVRICGGAITVRNGDEVWRCVRCRATLITDQQKARFAVKVA